MVVRDGLKNIASHHVESFDFAMSTCLPRMNQYMLTAEVAQPPSSQNQEGMSSYPFDKLKIWFEDFQLKTPERIDSN